MATTKLPEDIQMEVFSRLPAKSVGRFRCLSKSWNIYLSSEKFIKFHLSRKSHNQKNLLLINEYESGSYGNVRLITDPIKDDVISRKVKLLQSKWNVIGGSCNGLVLLLNNLGGMSVVNPITWKQVNTHDIPSEVVKNAYDGLRYGFGYDSSNDDYKIVVHYYYGYKVDAYIIVYSLKNGFWKDFVVSPFNLYGYGAYVNGSIHWAAARGCSYNKAEVIAAFDVAKEVFFEIPSPAANVDDEKIFTYTFIHDGCLSVVSHSYSNIWMEFWIMKEYGSRESWTKFSVYESGNYVDLRSIPLCFIEEEQVVMMPTFSNCVIIKSKDGTMKNMVVDGDYFNVVSSAGTFIDSLISPC